MNNELTLDNLIAQDGPTCLVIKARLEPVGDQDRFQPAGFPEIGHVIYDAPRKNGQKEKVCIIDSAASMANHLESVCMAGPNDTELHSDLLGLPHVVCVTDRNFIADNGEIKVASSDLAALIRESFGVSTKEAEAGSEQAKPSSKTVVTSLTEGHRVASDYFLDGLLNPHWIEERTETKKKGGKEETNTISAQWEWTTFRDQLRKEFGIVEVVKDKKYFIHPEDWWAIYSTIFKYDPNSLVHGILLAKEQIKISRLLTASLEAFGAARVGSSGVKFDRLGKTLSGQPIFAVDEETADEIRATFILDLALLRSYGRNGKGLNENQKKVLLGLALWKIKRLLAQPFRFRSQCYLKCATVDINADQISEPTQDGLPPLLANLQMFQLKEACNFNGVTNVYYPAKELFKAGKEEASNDGALDGDDGTASQEDEDGADN